MGSTICLFGKHALILQNWGRKKKERRANPEVRDDTVGRGVWKPAMTLGFSLLVQRKGNPPKVRYDLLQNIENIAGMANLVVIIDNKYTKSAI